MKNTLCIALIALVHLSVKAQTEKGRWNAGVSIGSFDYQKGEYGHSFSASVRPTAGYFAATNLLVGIGVPFGHTSQTYDGPVFSQSGQTTLIGLSPFARYYVGSSRLKPYVGLAYSFSHQTTHNENTLNTPGTPTETNTRSISTVLTPSLGLAYFLTNSISVDAQLGYNWNSSKVTYDSVVSTDFPRYSYRNATLAIGFNIFF